VEEQKVVVDSCCFANCNRQFVHSNSKHFSRSDFYLSFSLGTVFSMKSNKHLPILSFLKKTNEIFSKVLNFILLVPAFYVGVGISALFWKISHKKVGKKKSFWKESEKLSDDSKDYYKQY